MAEIRRIGVVGAGTMGHGIAQVSAVSGYDVVLVDVAPQALERGIAQIGKSLEKLESKGKLTADQIRPGKQRLQRIVRMLVGLIKRKSARDYERRAGAGRVAGER